MEIIAVQHHVNDDDDFIVDDFDLICLYNKYYLHQDARMYIIWDALYIPSAHIERKLAYDWVRREKLLRGLVGPTRDVMNLAVGDLRRHSNQWMENNNSFKFKRS